MRTDFAYIVCREVPWEGTDLIAVFSTRELAAQVAHWLQELDTYCYYSVRCEKVLS